MGKPTLTERKTLLRQASQHLAEAEGLLPRNVERPSDEAIRVAGVNLRHARELLRQALPETFDTLAV